MTYSDSASFQDDSSALENPSQNVVEQAVFWKVRLDSNNDDPTLMQQFKDWLEEDSEHRLAWNRIEQMGQELEADLSRFPNKQAALDSLDDAAQGQQSKRNSLKLLTLLALGGSTSLLAYRYQPWQADYHTELGQNRQIVLADGSLLQMNTDTAVDVRFTDNQRLIVLHRGEIHIESGADTDAGINRPLRVQTPQAIFEALGTRFLVRKEDQQTLLWVEESRVSITTTNGLNQIAEAGETYRVGQTIEAETNANIEPGAWTRGVLVVNNIRLEDFLIELSRYRSGSLGSSEEVADLRLSGVFQLDNPDALLNLLPELLPVAIASRTRWWVRVIPEN